MRRKFEIDIISLLLYLALVLMGWLTIYAVSSDGGEISLFDLGTNHGKQLIWIGISLLTGVVVLSLDNRLIESMATYILYGASILLLILVIFIGKEVNGAKSWLIIAGIQIQPAEFAKVATALALARYMSQLNFSLKNQRQALTAFAIVALPALIVIAQNDTGSALVFGSFLIVFFREGLNPVVPVFLIAIGLVAISTLWVGNPWYISLAIVSVGLISYWLSFNRRQLIGLTAIHLLIVAFFIGLSFSTDLIVKKLPDHQQKRIMVLFDPDIDKLGAGYNVRQSKIAIGSGGFWGKGFLDGYYTKGDFVPKQVTDFIFCTVGEELGWVGSSFVLLIFFGFLTRIRFLAENAKTRFARIYGYSVLSILFFHLLVNVGMTIGLVPVIGIPLPFFSYGGSSLLAFTLLIAVLLNLYAYRSNVLGRKA
jgi:rod shape determining protein RodA